MTKVILIPGSLRKDSLNVHLLQVCESILKSKGVETTFVGASSLDIPLINTDNETTNFPQTVKEISESILTVNGVIIASPEYNGSISPIIKNFVDWTSRLKPHPWKFKNVLLTGTSPGYFGTIRSLQHTRVPFEALGAFVYPQPYALPQGDKLLGAGMINDPAKHTVLVNLIDDFLKYLR